MFIEPTSGVVDGVWTRSVVSEAATVGLVAVEGSPLVFHSADRRVVQIFLINDAEEAAHAEDLSIDDTLFTKEEVINRIDRPEISPQQTSDSKHLITDIYKRLRIKHLNPLNVVVQLQ